MIRLKLVALMALTVTGAGPYVAPGRTTTTSWPFSARFRASRKASRFVTVYGSAASNWTALRSVSVLVSSKTTREAVNTTRCPSSAAASNTAAVPAAFTSRYTPMSCDVPPSTAAACTTAEQPPMAARTEAASVMSPVTSSTPRSDSGAAFCGARTRARTGRPCSARIRQTFPPMRPVPPVTRTGLFDSVISTSQKVWNRLDPVRGGLGGLPLHRDDRFGQTGVPQLVQPVDDLGAAGTGDGGGGPDAGGVAAEDLGAASDLRTGLRDLLDRRAEPEPAVAQAGHPIPRGGTAAADPDRNPARAGGFRVAVQRGE